MLEFLLSQNSSEAPGFLSILLSVLSSLFLSFLIVITYEVTTPDRPRSVPFLQSLALISIVAATVMQAIGDSLARGLGMLGALAIIRFRTRLNNPRNMTFMFASLAVGISCGVFGFTIAFVGTAVFCLTAFVLHFSRFSRTNDLPASLKIVSTIYQSDDPKLAALLRKFCSHWSVKQYQVNALDAKSKETGESTDAPSSRREITYAVFFQDQANANHLMEALDALEGIENLRLRFETTSNEL